MTNPFTDLPKELLDAILDSLQIKDVVQIYTSSPSYLTLLESILFAPENLDETIAVCCQEGYNNLIAMSISRGGDPSVCAVRISSDRKGRASTLVVAARAKQDHTFRFLLELGASMDEFGPKKSMQLCRTLLSRPEGPSLLHAYLQARPRHIFAISEAILGGAQIATIQLMLDVGGDANLLKKMGGHSWMSPLSAAVVTYDAAAFDLLVESGADIHGPTLYIRADQTRSQHISPSLRRPSAWRGRAPR